MDKYRKPAEKRLSSKTHPDVQAREALANAAFASSERQEFFDGVNGNIMIDYFLAWIKTEPHEVKTREFLYNCVLALGSVKEKLIQYETLGKNIPIIQEDQNG